MSAFIDYTALSYKQTSREMYFCGKLYERQTPPHVGEYDGFLTVRSPV